MPRLGARRFESSVGPESFRSPVRSERALFLGTVRSERITIRSKP
jgi:hypothetical protein